MKKNLQKMRSHFSLEISQARANGFEGTMLPFDLESDVINLLDIEDDDYIFELAEDYGWDRFIVIDFLNSNEKIIDMFEVEAA